MSSRLPLPFASRLNDRSIITHLPTSCRDKIYLLCVGISPSPARPPPAPSGVGCPIPSAVEPPAQPRCLCSPGSMAAVACEAAGSICNNGKGTHRVSISCAMRFFVSGCASKDQSIWHGMPPTTTEHHQARTHARKHATASSHPPQRWKADRNARQPRTHLCAYVHAATYLCIRRTSTS